MLLCFYNILYLFIKKGNGIIQHTLTSTKLNFLHVIIVVKYISTDHIPLRFKRIYFIFFG